MTAFTFNAEAFALFVRTRRDKLGLSVTDAAKDAKVSRPQLYRSECGQPINIAGFLTICIWIEKNPFAFLLEEETGRCMAELPEAAASRETGETRGSARNSEPANA